MSVVHRRGCAVLCYWARLDMCGDEGAYQRGSQDDIHSRACAVERVLWVWEMGIGRMLQAVSSFAVAGLIRAF